MIIMILLININNIINNDNNIINVCGNINVMIMIILMKSN